MAAVYPTSNAGFDPATAQPLPTRPGAMAAQPLRPKGQVTAGRPLPARAGDPPVAAAAAPTVASAVDASLVDQQTVASAAPVAARAPAPSAAPAAAAAPSAVALGQPRSAKPDARPMRLAFGAGAVAAVSALTIGMVKPDFIGGSADEASASSSEDAPVAAPANDRVRVRHVTDYVLLKPGEKPPRGATVISAAELLGVSEPRVNRNAGNSGDQRVGRDQREPQPQPDPPRVETRQSGG